MLVQIMYRLGKHRASGTSLITSSVQYVVGHSFLTCLILLRFSVRSLFAQSWTLGSILGSRCLNVFNLKSRINYQSEMLVFVCVHGHWKR